MIKLKLSFGKDHKTETTFEIVEDESLLLAIERSTKDVPLGEFNREDVFNVVVNGHIVDPKFWKIIRLRAGDSVVISPKMLDGDFGQVFGQILILAATIAVAWEFPPAAAFANGLLVAGVAIGMTLAMKALIPPPEVSQNGGGISDGRGGLADSQMYAITGQSNEMKRLGVVPKVYGSHRIFPTLAANPYTELAVDPATGEVIQYLCGVYDFGLGCPQISDLKIGDTPVSVNAFDDFNYRFVDPLRADVPADAFEAALHNKFTLYKGDRSVNSLSFALTDGNEIIQNTANNPDDLQPEIILDLVCPKGLYGYSSSGELGNRRVDLRIDFAPVGSSDWKPYNDLSAVDTYEDVGGTDVTSFKTNLVAIKPDDPSFGTYYEKIEYTSYNYYSTDNYTADCYVPTGANRYLVPAPPGESEWQVGHEVFTQDFFLGIIQSITPVGGNFEILVDRGCPLLLSAFQWRGHVDWANNSEGHTVPVYNTSPYNIFVIRSSFIGPSVAAISGGSTSPVYASFKFKPKATGQFQVRIRRISASGSFIQQFADDVTWAGITTAFDRSPINTDKRHVFMEIKIRATDQLNGNIANLSAVATQPLDVYDQNTETWSRQITSNPAWVFVDLLTGEVNKKAVPKSRLHLDSILAWRDYCDEIPTPPPTQTYIFPRFQCNFILDYDTTLQEVLQQVGSSAQASLNVIDGKYGVLVDRLKTTPVQVFTPRNSRDFSSTRDYSPRPHGVKVKYIDPQLGWEVSEVIVYDNGYDETNATKFDDLTSFACTSHEQAWRFGRYMIAQNKLRQETMNLLVDFEQLVCTRGDYVQISQDVMEVGGRPARVKAVSGTQITIDDALDIDGSLSYGIVHRAADGLIQTLLATPIDATNFAVASSKVIFSGDTRSEAVDISYRHGLAPAVIGAMRKALAVAGTYSAGDTTYVLPEAPLNSNEIISFLDGAQRSDFTLSGNVVRFVGMDTTSQVFDCHYRHSATDVIGTQRKITGLSGIYNGSDTVYTLPEAPISDDDFLPFLDGAFRSDPVLVGVTVTFVGQDTTTQDFDTQYRHVGGSGITGTGRTAYNVTGVYDGTNTTYTLPEAPLSNDDLLVFKDGIERVDYSQGITMPAVGDLVVIGEVGQIVFDCIVKSISPNDDLSAQITLVERANDIFDYESSDVLPDYNPQISNTSRPDFYPPKAVTDLTLVDNTWECSATKSGYNYYADVSWNIPPGSVYEFFEIWVNEGRGYKKSAQTSAKTYRHNIDQSRMGIEHGIKVVAVAASGKKLQIIQMPEVTFTPVVKNEAPSDVTGFGISITNQTLQLSWPAITDCDAASYELRFSSDDNDVWEASTLLQVVDKNVNSVTVQARTGVYLIKAIDFAGNKSANAARAITTIPNLFDVNIIETLDDSPNFTGQKEFAESLGSAVILSEKTSGTVDTMAFFPAGYYYVIDTLDLGDIYSVRLASYVRADGYRFGELMSDWSHLSDVSHLSTSGSEDWNVTTEYRATDQILAMSDWAHLSDIAHLNEGIGSGFTDWRPIPTMGDATGRVFQFRIKLESLTPNVTPRVFDGTIKADMPDRTDNFENLVSSGSDWTTVFYEKPFHGPSPAPNVQISIDNAASGDYWEFQNKNLEGFQIKFYDSSNTLVSRRFDVAAKGYGARHTVTI